MENHKQIPIGHVGVDSGRLLIVDPAHLGGDELQTLLQQLDVEQPPPSGVTARQLNYSRGQAGLGVGLVAGWGDGSYTVEADTFDDENGFTIIREIRVRFTEYTEASSRSTRSTYHDSSTSSRVRQSGERVERGEIGLM